LRAIYCFTSFDYTMAYNKKTNDYKEIYKKWWALIHSITGIPYTLDQLIENKSRNTIVNKKGFNKVFKKYPITMKYDPKEYWYCIMRANHGLSATNELSNTYLQELKSTMSKKWLYNLLQRLVEKGMIARVSRGQYVLNPQIAQYGERIDKNIYKLFE